MFESHYLSKVTSNTSKFRHSATYAYYFIKHCLISGITYLIPAHVSVRTTCRHISRGCMVVGDCVIFTKFTLVIRDSGASILFHVQCRFFNFFCLYIDLIIIFKIFLFLHLPLFNSVVKNHS
jgi:hypothetical protein